MNKKVSYLYNEAIADYTFSKDHPMKPMRIKMVHELIYNYGLTNKLDMYHSKEASSLEMMQFHHPHYIKYLETWVNPKASKIV